MLLIALPDSATQPFNSLWRRVKNLNTKEKYIHKNLRKIEIILLIAKI